MVGRYGLLAVTAVVFMLLAAPALAFTVSDVHLDYYGTRVVTIAPDKSLAGVRFAATLSKDASACFDTLKTRPCLVVMNAPTLGVDKSVIDVRANCLKSADGTYNCTSAAFTLTSKENTHTVSYRGQMDTKQTPLAQATIALRLDTSRPVVSSIVTGYCADEECFAAANQLTPVTVTFSDTMTVFDYRQVFLGVEGRPILQQAKSCTANSCLAELLIPCGEGERVTLNVRSVAGKDSREDAQNAIILGKSQPVVCTTKAPEILSWSSKADGVGGQAVSGGGIVYTARVRSVGEPIVSVNATNVSMRGACDDDASQEAGVYSCSWTFSGLSAGKFSYLFTVMSPVGLRVTKTEPLTVLNLTTKTDSKGRAVAPNFYSTNAVVDPAPINRMAIDLARANYLPYPTYVSYTLEKLPASKGRLVRQELKECWYKLKNETNYTKKDALFSFGGQRKESHVLYADKDGENVLSLQSRASRETLAKADTFDVKCQLDIVVAEGGNIYSTPEPENITFTVTLRESPLGQPGQAFVKKIKHEEEKLNGGMAETIRKLEKLRQTGSQICGYGNTISEMKTAFSAMGAIGHGLCTTGVAAAAGATIGSVGGSGSNAANGFLNGALDGCPPTGLTIACITKGAAQLAAPPSFKAVADGPIKSLCYQVNCRYTADAESSNYEGWSDFGDYLYDEMKSGADMMNPDASITGAAFAMCAGGVIYNMQKWQAIDCGYLQCLREQSSSGLSVATCDLGKNYRVCTQVMGEVGELPFIRTYKNYLANIDSMVKNLPWIVGRYAHKTQCIDYQDVSQVAASITSTGGCLDTKMVVCALSGSVIDVMDTGRMGKKASQGIDEEKAKMALQICTDAAKNKPSAPYAQAAENYFSMQFLQRLQAGQKDTNYQTASGAKTSQALINAIYASYITSGGDASFEEFINIYPITRDAQATPGLWALEPEQEMSFALRNKDGKCPGGLCDETFSFSTVGYTEDVVVQLKEKNSLIAAKDGVVLKEVSKYDDNGNQIPNSKFTVSDQADGYVNAKNFFSGLNTNQLTLIDKRIQLGDAKKSCSGQSCTAINDQITKLDKELRMTGITVKPGPDGTVIGMGVQKIGPDGKPVIDPSSGNPIVEEKTLTENGASISKALGKLQAQERLNTLASYAAKFALQAGWLDWARTSEWWETMPVVEDLLHYTGNYLNYEQFSQNLCNDLVYDIKDNDEGAIFQPGGLSVPIVVGTFGSEVLPVQNASKGYLYITATLVVNPTRQDQLGMKKGDYDYKLRVVLKDLQECDSECEPSVDLTNGAWFNLSAGNTFGNGNMPKTRIDHLQGRYGKLCVEFDKPFPDPKAATSKKSYCRTINVNTFERGTSVVPPTTGGSRGGTGGTGGTSGTGGTGPTGPDPLGGWQ